jgi:hypothetical protein
MDWAIIFKIMKNKPIDFYLKWIATAILIVASALNSLGYYPIGPILYLVGGLAWLIVSIMWKEPALIATNVILASVNAIGLTITYFTQ